MPGTDRLASEQAFHDRQAFQRAGTFADVQNLLFADESYLNHETWVRPAFERLGAVSGKRILDLGCGHGMAAVVLARRGAHVVALDLSAGYLEEARLRAQANSVVVRFVKGDAERLPFADGSLDAIWGNAVLHHLDANRAAHELARVLACGGVAVFCEPWGENPLLRWARQWLPYSAKSRTPDETPLRLDQLRLLRSVFRTVEVRGYQLLSMARRVWPQSHVMAGLDWCDHLLLSRVPRLQHYCRYVVLTLRK